MTLGEGIPSDDIRQADGVGVAVYLTLLHRQQGGGSSGDGGGVPPPLLPGNGQRSSHECQLTPLGSVGVVAPPRASRARAGWMKRYGSERVGTVRDEAPEEDISVARTLLKVSRRFDSTVAF